MGRVLLTAALAVAAGVLGGCSASESAQRRPDGDGTPFDPKPGSMQRADAGAQVEAPAIVTTQRVEEDFNSLWYVDTASVAVIDVNVGLATLPGPIFPRISETDPITIEDTREARGVLSGGSIIVRESGVIEGSDAVELRAQDTLRITGKVRAGNGGVTLVAGSAIHVDGEIASAGPIRVRVAADEGVIEIAGKVYTTSREGMRSGEIILASRGEIRIGGEVRTGTAAFADSGRVEIASYGAITISGVDALVASGTSEQGDAGGLDLSSETAVRVLDGARVAGGDSTRKYPGRSRGAGGAVRIRAETVQVGVGAHLIGGASDGGQGGEVHVTASDVFASGSTAEIAAGQGDTGGTVWVESRTATAGAASKMSGGAGVREAGRVRLETGGDIALKERAALKGGDGRCTSGGAVVILAGGALAIEPGVVLRGGSGGTDAGADCVGTFPGGNVQVVAQEVQGPYLAAANAGAGTPPGAISVRLDPSFTQPTPEIRVERVGEVISKTIDRGEASIGKVPRLVERRETIPAGTYVKIQLAGAESAYGPFDAWHDAKTEEPELLAPVASFRYLRYRLWMKGRALDAPIVDYFELDLAPAR